MINRIKCALIDLSYGAILVILGWVDSKVNLAIGVADDNDQLRFTMWVAFLVSILGFIFNHSVFTWLFLVLRESRGEMIKRGPEVAVWQWALIVLFVVIVLLAVTE